MTSTRQKYIEDTAKTFFKVLNISPSSEYWQAITKIIECVSFQHNIDNKVGVIPLSTGGGKTTLIKQMLPMLYKYDPSITGSIILVPYSDIKYDGNCTEIAAEINKIAGCDIALPLDSNNIKANRKIIKNYPILVLTHQRYRQKFNMFKDFLCWTDGSINEATGKQNVYYRKRLLIDEALAIMDVIEIDPTAIAKLTELFQGLQNNKDCREFESIANKLNKSLEIPLNNENVGLRHIKINLSISDRLKSVVQNYGTQLQQRYFTGINNLTITGGYVNYSKQEDYRKIYSCTYTDIFDGLFDVHIFDGTASINELYKYDKFNILEIPIIKNYDNVQIHIDHNLKSSRSFLEKNPDVINKTIEYIRDRLDRKKVLLITHASIEGQVKELLIRNNLNDRVCVEHWNGTSGSNKYAEYDSLVFLGLNYLSDIYYIFLYHLYNFNFDFNGKITACTPRKNDPVKRFHDVDYEAVRQSAMAVDITQAINRIRCRQYNNGQALETHIFLGYNDNKVLNKLKIAMPGIQVVEDFDIGLGQFKSYGNSKTNVEIILDRLLNHVIYFPDRKEISKAELFDGVCSSYKTKSKILQHPSIISLEDSEIVKFTYKTVKFVS